MKSMTIQHKLLSNLNSFMEGFKFCEFVIPRVSHFLLVISGFRKIDVAIRATLLNVHSN